MSTNRFQGVVPALGAIVLVLRAPGDTLATVDWLFLKGQLPRALKGKSVNQTDDFTTAVPWHFTWAFSGMASGTKAEAGTHKLHCLSKIKSEPQTVAFLARSLC